MMMQQMLLWVVLVVDLMSYGACITPINKDITRNIDATEAIVRMNIEIEIENLEKGDVYSLILPGNATEHLAYLSISRTNKKNEMKILDITSQRHIITRGSSSAQMELMEYNIIAPIKNPTLNVQAVFTSILVPLPKEISQEEDQLVQLFDNHYVLSPYHTKSQKTIVQLPQSKSMESFTKLQPYSYRNSKLELGPYKRIEAYELSPLKIHYINNNPFAKFSEMTREVEVSHWGQVWLEEMYTLKHAGAKLKGGFSRLDYSRAVMEGVKSTGSSFKRLYATLPRQARNIYYRDQIGNISTSDMVFSKDRILFGIETRFPIYGGWQTEFYIGYSLPTETMLTIDPKTDRYTLTVNFYTSFEEVWVEDMELKIVLPEGSTGIDVQVPYTHNRSDSVRYTFFDSKWNGGRPVIIINSKNLVQEHNKQVVISYNYSKMRMLVEPLMLIACFFCFFMGCCILNQAVAGNGSGNVMDQNTKNSVNINNNNNNNNNGDENKKNK